MVSDSEFNLSQTHHGFNDGLGRLDILERPLAIEHRDLHIACIPLVRSQGEHSQPGSLRTIERPLVTGASINLQMEGNYYNAIGQGRLSHLRMSRITRITHASGCYPSTLHAAHLGYLLLLYIPKICFYFLISCSASHDCV